MVKQRASRVEHPKELSSDVATDAQRGTSILLWTAMLFVGILLGFYLLPRLYYILPNDMARVKNIFEAIHHGESPLPEIVVLGNSVVMNGIDGRQMNSILPGNPPVWNLSGPGQNLLESGLILDEIDFPVRAVVLGILPGLLTEPQVNIPQNKLIAYKIYGYQPSTETLAAFSRIVDKDTENLLHQSWWRTVIQSRWIVRSFIDNGLRSALRSDLTLERAQSDLFFPVAYTEKISSAAQKSLMERLHVKRGQMDGYLSIENQQLLEYYWAQLNDQDIEFYVLVLPEHPNQIQLTHADYYKNLEQDLDQLDQEKMGFHVINLYDLLQEDDFIDHVHTYETGAIKLTEALVNKLLESEAIQ